MRTQEALGKAPASKEVQARKAPACMHSSACSPPCSPRFPHLPTPCSNTTDFLFLLQSLSCDWVSNPLGFVCYLADVKLNVGGEDEISESKYSGSTNAVGDLGSESIGTGICTLLQGAAKDGEPCMFSTFSDMYGGDADLLIDFTLAPMVCKDSECVGGVSGSMSADFDRSASFEGTCGETVAGPVSAAQVEVVRYKLTTTDHPTPRTNNPLSPRR